MSGAADRRFRVTRLASQLKWNREAQADSDPPSTSNPWARSRPGGGFGDAEPTMNPLLAKFFSLAST